MSLFGKNKLISKNEDDLIDNLTDDGDTTPKHESTSVGTGATTARIEKLDAQLVALREVLDAQQERFERHTEELGELRNMVNDREKTMGIIEAKSNKITELIEAVQPETLMSEQKKTDARIEAIKAKMENSELLSNNILDELKKIKNDMSVFRGTDEILKLNKEVREELISIKKVEGSVLKHADKVEAMFSTFESNFEEFEKLKDGFIDLSELSETIRKDVEKNKALIATIPKNEEFFKLKKEVGKTLESVDSAKSIFVNRNKSYELGLDNLSKRIKIMESKIDKNLTVIAGSTKDLNQTNIQLRELIDDVYDIKKTQNNIGIMDKKLNENSTKIDMLVSLIEKMVVNNKIIK